MTTEELHIQKLTPWCLHQMACLTLKGVKFTLLDSAMWEVKWGDGNSYRHGELWQVIHLAVIARGEE